jgi:hypothetical protein
MTTAESFAAIMTEFQAAEAALDPDGIDVDAAAEARYAAAFEGVRNARPTDPRHIAWQLRWLAEELGAADRQDDAILLHAADVLEAMARRAAA